MILPSGSLPSPSGGSARSGTPSADLGDLLGAGAGQGTTAPRMSNAMARSLGLVPPKETRTRTLGRYPSSARSTDGPATPPHSLCIWCNCSLLLWENTRYHDSLV